MSLGELVSDHPLQQGLAELVAYLQLGSDAFETVVDDDTAEHIAWRSLDRDGCAVERAARLPRVIFVK